MSHGSNRGKYIKENYQIWLKYADTVKTAIKKLTDTLEKHMHHFQCQQSEFKCKKSARSASDQNKQCNYRYHTLSCTHHDSQNCVILYDNPTIIFFNNNNNAPTIVSLYNFTQN